MGYLGTSKAVAEINASIEALERARERILEAEVTDSDPLLTNAEACEYVKSSPASWNRLRYSGEGPSYYSLAGGRRIHWRKSELDKWLESQKVSTCSLSGESK